MMYQLSYMQEPNSNACVACKTRGIAKVMDGSGHIRKPGATTTIPFPDLLIHGTDINAALSILCDRTCRPGPGICGFGIYGFRLASLDTEEVVKQFNRCAAGGYNQGAAIVMECDGLLVQCKNGEVVPDGAVSCVPKSKATSYQYCALPSSVKYVAVIFNVKGLVHCWATI